MKQVDSITLGELEVMAEKMYGELVKAVVDVKNRIVVVDAGLHVDEEQYLLENGSKQSDLWAKWRRVRGRRYWKTAQSNPTSGE